MNAVIANYVNMEVYSTFTLAAESGALRQSPQMFELAIYAGEDVL
jgi:hypothetical protein